MPLRAVLDGKEIFAFTYDEQQWRELKKVYRAHQLLTYCCDQRAIPKASKLGTRFFAHAREDGCATAPETQEHLYLKTIFARAAIEAGWHVAIEQPGGTPDGEAWIADVLCQKGSARVAVEIQWSSQTLEEFARRQERYRSSGVRALWLYRIKGNRRLGSALLPTVNELPLFGLRKSATTGEIDVPGFGVHVEDFATTVMAGRLTWRPTGRHRKQLGISVADVICTRCGHAAEAISGAWCYEDGVNLGHIELHEEGMADLVYRLVVRQPGVLPTWAVRFYPRQSDIEQAIIANGCACGASFGPKSHGPLWWEPVVRTPATEPVCWFDIPIETVFPVEPRWYLGNTKHVAVNR